MFWKLMQLIANKLPRYTISGLEKWLSTLYDVLSYDKLFIIIDNYHYNFIYFYKQLLTTHL